MFGPWEDSHIKVTGMLVATLRGGRSEQLLCAHVGVFTDQFIFRGFGANFEYLLNSTNQSAIFFALLFSFAF